MIAPARESVKQSLPSAFPAISRQLEVWSRHLLESVADQSVLHPTETYRWKVVQFYLSKYVLHVFLPIYRKEAFISSKRPQDAARMRGKGLRS